MAGLPKPSLLRRAQTIFSEEEFAKIQDYLKRKKLRMYTFLKMAAFDFIKRNP